MGKAARIKAVKATTLKLDFGCGPNPREGFEGVDRIKFKGVTHQLDIACERWPWKDGTVAEAHASHFLEHLTNVQRVHFVNELWRILVLGGTCQIIVPHWASNRAYGDPTHQWPPVSEMWMYYLNREWRKSQAPHTDIEYWPDGFMCNFEATWSYSLRPDLNARNDEYRNFAMQNYKEVCQDSFCTLTKRE